MSQGKREPNEARQAFALEVAKGVNHREAYKRAYPNGDPKYAYAKSKRLLRLPEIQELINTYRRLARAERSRDINDVLDGLWQNATSDRASIGESTSAYLGYAKVAGMIVEKTENKNQNYNFTRQEVMVIGLVGDPETRRALDLLAERLEGQSGGNGG